MIIIIGDVFFNINLKDFPYRRLAGEREYGERDRLPPGGPRRRSLPTGEPLR